MIVRHTQQAWIIGRRTVWWFIRWNFWIYDDNDNHDDNDDHDDNDNHDDDNDDDDDDNDDDDDENSLMGLTHYTGGKQDGYDVCDQDNDNNFYQMPIQCLE